MFNSTTTDEQPDSYPIRMQGYKSAYPADLFDAIRSLRLSEIYGDGNADFAMSLLGILNMPRAALQNKETGDYNNPRLDVKPSEVQDHLNGRHTLGFASVKKRKAHFLGMDIDEQWSARLPIIKAVLEDMELATAAFCTTGSSPERGKVIVVLDRPMLQENAVRLIQTIYARCTWAEGIHKTSIYPNGGRDGGLVRVGGRNCKRADVVDQFLDLDGNPLSGFNAIIPYQVGAQQREITRPKMPEWTRTLRYDGFRRSRHHNDIYLTLNKVAYFIVSSYGPDGAVQAMESYLRDVASNSPEIMKSDSGKRRLFEEREATVYINSAMRQHIRRTWEPMALTPVHSRREKIKWYQTSEGAKVPLGAARLYRKMAEYVVKKGVSHNALRIDQESLADYCGVSREQISKDIKAAVKCGLVTIAEKGGCFEGRYVTSLYRLT